MRAWLMLRTGLAFALIGVSSLALALTAIPLIGLLSRQRERGELRVQRLIHHCLRGYLRAVEWLGVFRIRCSGARRLREPGTLVVANHPTMLDAVALIALMPQADCVVKQGYLRNAFLGSAVRAAGYISNDGGSAVVDACAERLVRGRSLIVFPEGTRSPDRGFMRFQRGAAHIALQAGCDPLPVTITCEPPALKRGQQWWQVPERRFDLDLEVGDPIVLKDVAGEHETRGRAARALTAAMRDYFEKRASRAAAKAARG